MKPAFEHLVAVKDRYGTRYLVHAAQFRGGRTLLRLYNPTTGTPIETPPDRSAVSVPYLHRENICEHVAEEVIIVRALGREWTECPHCRSRDDAEAARLLDGWQAQPSIAELSRVAAED